MSDQERLGRLDDEAEAEEQASATEGPSTKGDYDPAEGSPGRPHPPTEEGFSDEITRYDTDAEQGTGAGDGGTGS
jgi:hypothetical protein